MSLYNQITNWTNKTAFLLGYHDNFWGKYASISDFDNISLEAAARYQQQKLENYFNVMGAFHPKYQKAYDFIKNSEKTKEYVSQDSLVSVSINKIFSGIAEVYNSFFKKSKIYNSKFSANFSEEQSKKIKEIDESLKALSLNNLFVEDSFLEHFENLINSSIDIKDYQNKKSDDMENLAKEAFSNYLENSGIVSIVTGKLRNSRGQIIQDVMNIDVDIFNGIIKKTKTNYNFSDLLNEIDSTPDNKQLTLENELYEALSQASLVSAQVKSGINQPIYNERSDTMYSNISIGDLSGPYDSAFVQLQELAMLDNPQWILKNDGDKQNIVAAMNYELADKAIDLLHGNENENQLLLTNQGFISFQEYLIKHKNTWQFQDSVGVLDGNFIAKKRKVVLRRSLISK